MLNLFSSNKASRVQERIVSLKKAGYKIIYVSNVSGRIGYARKDLGYMSELVK